LDSGEPRWRSQTANTANEPTARNSDCQFWKVPSQKSALPTGSFSHLLGQPWESPVIVKKTIPLAITVRQTTSMMRMPKWSPAAADAPRQR
jgi:hypothetical protein